MINDPNSSTNFPVTAFEEPYAILAEVNIDKGSDFSVLPRKYKVFMSICLPANETVDHVSIDSEQRNDSDVVRRVKVVLKKGVGEGAASKLRWLTYEFFLDKFVEPCKWLQFYIDGVTDPKDKVIFEDPDEIDPNGPGSNN